MSALLRQTRVCSASPNVGRTYRIMPRAVGPSGSARYMKSMAEIENFDVRKTCIHELGHHFVALHFGLSSNWRLRRIGGIVGRRVPADERDLSKRALECGRALRPRRNRG